MRSSNNFKHLIALSLLGLAIIALLTGCGTKDQGPTKEEINKYTDFLNSTLDRVSAQALSAAEEVSEIETKADVQNLIEAFKDYKEISRKRFSNVLARNAPSGFEEIHEELVLICASDYFANTWFEQALEGMENSAETGLKVLDAATVMVGYTKLGAMDIARELQKKLEESASDEK